MLSNCWLASGLMLHGCCKQASPPKRGKMQHKAACGGHPCKSRGSVSIVASITFNISGLHSIASHSPLTNCTLHYPSLASCTWLSCLHRAFQQLPTSIFHNGRMREPPPSLLGQRMARHCQRTQFERRNDLQDRLRLAEIVSSTVHPSIRSTATHRLRAKAV